MVVWKLWLGFAISAEIHCVTAVTVLVSAFATLKSAKSCAFAANSVQCSCILVANVANWLCDFGGCVVVCGGFDL